MVELLNENLNIRGDINLESKALKCMPSPVIENNASTDALQYGFIVAKALYSVHVFLNLEVARILVGFLQVYIRINGPQVTGVFNS